MRASRRRLVRALIWSTAAILVVAAAGWCYLTHPRRLQRCLLEALASWPATAAGVDEVQFHLAGAVEIRGLELVFCGFGNRQPERTPGRRSVAAAPSCRLHVDYVQARCDLLSLLTGGLRTREIELDGVDLSVVLPVASDAGEVPFAEPGPNSIRKRRSFLTNLPQVSVPDATIRFFRAEPGGPRLVRQWRVTVAGRPSQEGYELRVQRAGQAGSALLSALWQAGQSALELRSDWLDLDTVALLTPAQVTRTLRNLLASGRVRLERVLIRWPQAEARSDPGLIAAELQLEGLECLLPIEYDVDSIAGRWMPFARLRDGRFALSIDSVPQRTAVRLRGSARVNDAQAELRLAAAADDWERLLSTPDSVEEAELTVAGLTLPDGEQRDSLIGSPRLPQALRYFLNDFQPGGTVNLQVRARRAEDGRALRVEGEVEAVAARCRYRRFPYDFEQICGRAAFGPEGIRIHELRGRHGPACVSLRGTVNGARHATGFKLHAQATNVPLDADLLAALPTQYRHLWEAAAPLGLADLMVELQRPDGPVDDPQEPPTAVTVEACLLHGSLDLGDGRRLEEASGRLAVKENVVRIADLRGRLGGASVRLTGSLDISGGHGRLRCEVSDAPLAYHLHFWQAPGEAALRSSTDEAVEFVGRGDVWCDVDWRASPGSEASPQHAQRDYVVHVRDGRLTGFDGQEAWENCEGWITLSENGVRIRSFTARQDAATLTAVGAVPTPASTKQDEAPRVLHVEFADVPLERLIPQLVPRQVRHQVESLGLAGRGQISLDINVDQLGREAGPLVRLTGVAERMRPTVLPLPLENVEAEVTVASGRWQVHGFDADLRSGGHLRASGTVNSGGQGWTLDSIAEARNVRLAPELTAGLPGKLRELLERSQARGRVDLDLSRLVRAADGNWGFAGRARFQNADLTLGIPVRELTGVLHGSGGVDAQGRLVLEATLEAERAQLAGRRAENWQLCVSRSAQQRWLYLHDIQGRFCGGEVTAFARVDPDTGAYELSLTLRNVDLSQILGRDGSDAARAERLRQGRLDGHIYLRGRGSEAATREGGGSVRVRGGSFLHSPVLLAVARTRPPAQGGASDAIDQAEVHFVLAGTELRFTRLDVQGRDLRLVGEGSWDMQTDAIDLLLVGAHPANWPRVGVLSDLVELTGKELVQYRVVGTATEPQIRSAPLHRLNQAVRQLLERSE